MRSDRETTGAETAAPEAPRAPAPAAGPAAPGTAAQEPAPEAAPSRPGAARRLLGRTLNGAWNDDIFSESAAAAFWQTLSVPPLLLGMFGTLGFVGGIFGPDAVEAVQRWIIQLTGGFFSREALDEIVVPTVADILNTTQAGVVSVGFVLSFWFGSSAMAAFVDAITRAWDQYEIRNLVWQRVLAAVMYLVSLLTGIIAIPVLTLGPERLVPVLPDSWEGPVKAVGNALYSPLTGLVLLLALTTLYKVALPLKPPWYRGLPGALLAALVFLAGTTGLRLYLDWIASTGYTYGALGAPIAFLLVTFFIAFAIILGAHLNASVQALWPAQLRDRRGRCEKLGPGTPALRRAVHENPAAAAALLRQLRWRVEPPPGDAGDQPVEKSAR
ncbi:YihY/virulence factor BrkB family protein [Blastococcus sp. SYSU D00669]